jgi:xanthine dehydrogenase large subunit
LNRETSTERGEEFPYGQKAESEAKTTWSKTDEIYNIDSLRKQVQNFNKENKLLKKGIALMPICFGISFTKTLMNQARSLVHVYTDGTVGISTGAVEMGQGVNTKILQVAAHIFSIDPSKIKIHTTNTWRIANTSPTAASAAADLNGKATEIACKKILERLKAVAQEEHLLTADIGKTEIPPFEIKDEWIYVNGKKTEWSWAKLVMAAYIRRVNLSELAHYTPPGIYFDAIKEKGHPFAYHVYGTAIVTATVDCLRGTYTFDSVKAVHDFGASMNPVVDMGQCEGGIVQGIGWMTMEEIVYDKEGKLRSNALSTYKIPDIYSVPKEIEVHPLETSRDNLAVFRSKAVGEPPLMYGIGAYFALRNAIQAFNPAAQIPFDAPMTPEKLLMALHSRVNQTIRT